MLEVDTKRVTQGFEAQRWKVVDSWRGRTGAVEYEGVVLGLISLSYTTDCIDLTASGWMQ